jgi:ribosomal protein L37AE/L43A
MHRYKCWYANADNHIGYKTITKVRETQYHLTQQCPHIHSKGIKLDTYCIWPSDNCDNNTYLQTYNIPTKSLEKGSGTVLL